MELKPLSLAVFGMTVSISRKSALYGIIRLITEEKEDDEWL